VRPREFECWIFHDYCPGRELIAKMTTNVASNRSARIVTKQPSPGPKWTWISSDDAVTFVSMRFINFSQGDPLALAGGGIENGGSRSANLDFSLLVFANCAIYPPRSAAQHGYVFWLCVLTQTLACFYRVQRHTSVHRATHIAKSILRVLRP
jgi:hypothetical protein